MDFIIVIGIFCQSGYKNNRKTNFIEYLTHNSKTVEDRYIM